MPRHIDTGALLARTYELPSGPRVRLRLAHRSDVPGLRALLEQRGVHAPELALRRLVNYSPTERLVICATAPVDGSEAVVGVGAIELDADDPETLVVDERLTEGLGDLLAAALRGRTRRAA